MPRLGIGALLAALLFPTVPMLAQGVLVAPHAIVMDHRTRSGSLSLYNPGDDPAEVTLSTFFGYPITDSAGDFELKMIERPDASAPSAAAWVEAFPKRMLLAPKERQTVRLWHDSPPACPMASTGPGWWSRPKVARSR